MIGVGLSLTQPGKAPTAGPPLSVVVTPSSLPWTGGSGAWGTAEFTATVSNATGIPTYFWEVVLNTGVTVEADVPTAPATTLYSDDVTAPVGSTVHCTVTDDLGSAVSNTVSTT